MPPRNNPDRIRIVFDDHRLVANAGLLLPATLAQHLGLRELVDHHLGSNIAQGAAGADQPLHLQVQILVLRLSHRDPGVAVQRHPALPLAGIPEVWLSARGYATGFSSHPLSYDKGEFTAGGWKQGCFQPGPPA